MGHKPNVHHNRDVTKRLTLFAGKLRESGNSGLRLDGTDPTFRGWTIGRHLEVRCPSTTPPLDPQNRRRSVSAEVGDAADPDSDRSSASSAELGVWGRCTVE